MRKSDPYQTSFALRMEKTFVSLHNVLEADRRLRYYFLDCMIPPEWDGGYFLDGKLSEKIGDKHRKELTKLTASQLRGCDLEALNEHFAKAAEVFDPLVLPRHRICWLEHIARVHDAMEAKAEAAEVRFAIYKICAIAQDVCMDLWTIRPSLFFQRENGTMTIARQFYEYISDYKRRPPQHPWEDKSDLTRQMQVSLSKSAALYAKAGLVFLAERSWSHEISILRAEKNVESLAVVYENMSNAFKAASDEAVTNFALGAYYRVQYSGKGAPKYLIGKEFIYRNANHVRVAEFQVEMRKQLETLVEKGVSVSASSDTAYSLPADSKDAHVLVVAANPVLSQLKTDKSSVSADEMVYINQVRQFQYSVPFTKEGRTHAKEIHQQWKRTVTLCLDEPFPHSFLRQVVTSRKIRELTPIEVALEDIRDRVAVMSSELERATNDRTADKNNLMRIVQGSVAPQVNQGASEIAKVFLTRPDSTDNITPLEGVDEMRAPELTKSLKISLLDFLVLSKDLLRTCRTVLRVESLSIHDLGDEKRRVSARGLDDSRSGKQSHFNKIWQEEMETKFATLCNGILPYINDLPGMSQTISDITTLAAPSLKRNVPSFS
eukprot:CAMPEP_0182425746 /NCGR_PEP_ID=MMETSP1167-20130531/12235_1 /TAXON_ID=2988 /ORGANISM="Mallomonas Sp, Strain CCMP3275" /LENGTH=604 /DNA_ID=CAMNT_0024606713 /DNA_START=429 /DNA_END=2243 /DNA_ORIENTATION=+